MHSRRGMPVRLPILRSAATYRRYASSYVTGDAFPGGAQHHLPTTYLPPPGPTPAPTPPPAVRSHSGLTPYSPRSTNRWRLHRHCRVAGAGCGGCGDVAAPPPPLPPLPRAWRSVAVAPCAVLTCNGQRFRGSCTAATRGWTLPTTYHRPTPTPRTRWRVPFKTGRRAWTRLPLLARLVLT